ncbi:MAG: gliding motility-associated C-terminal domain-containing protein [Chitinophagales bacterium]
MYSILRSSHTIKLCLLLVLFHFWTNQSIQAQGLIVNEISQGEAASQKEFAELVVVGPPCTTVDIRGWIFDDNNGDFTDCPGPDNGAVSGTGIATGHIRFKYDPIWAEVPVGTIILLYANNPNLTIQQADIGGLPPDYDDADCDFLRVVPINASNTYMEQNTTSPSSSSGAGDNAACPNGVNGSPFYNIGTYGPIADDGFSGNFEFRNGGDAAQVRQPNGSYFHGFAYGTSAGGSPALIGGPDNLLLAGGGSDTHYFFNNTIGNDYTNAANFSSGTATITPGGQSPGRANSCLNAEWIESLRTAPDDEFQGAGCPNTASNTSICVGEQTTLSLTGCDSDSYLWNVSSGNATIVGANSGKSVEIQGTNAGNVTITVTATNTYDDIFVGTGCPATPQIDVFSFPFTITAPASPVIVGDDFCEGENTTLSTTTTYNQYLWSTGDATPTTNINSSGTYTVTVTDLNNCTATGETIITALQGPTIDIENNGGTNVLSLCEDGTTFLDAFQSGNGPYIYQWSNGSNSNGITLEGSVLGSGTHTYTVTVTDGLGCTGTDDASVYMIPLPSFGGLTINVCEDTPGSGTAANIDLTTYNDQINDDPNNFIDWYDGDLDVYTYIDNPTDVDLPPSNNALSVDIISPDCFTSIIIPYNIISLPTVTINGDDFCTGSSSTLSVVESFDNYNWSNGDTGQNISVNTSGTYTVTVSNTDGCSGTANITVNESPNLTPTVNGSDFCAGTTASLSVAQTYDAYNWSNGDAGQNISVTIAETYTVTVSDASGCSGTGQVTINELPPLNPTVNGSDFCNGQNGDLSVAETFNSYNWSNGDAGQNISVTIAGTYTVTVSDASGCTGTGQTTVNELILSSLTLNGEDFCSGQNSNLSVVEAFSGYTWSNGDIGQNITVNLPGTYTVTVSQANGCTQTSDITINELSGLTPSTTGNDFCTGSTTTLSVVENYNSYNWSNGDTGQNISVGIAGTYTVTVSDSNGCTGTSNVTVNELPVPNPSISGNDFCAGGTSVLTVNELFNNYVWSTAETTQMITVSNGGTYTVTVSNADNCTATANISINQFSITSPTLTGTDFCLDFGTTLAVVETYNSYNWSNGDAGQNISINTGGTYTVTVTNTDGCTATNAITVQSFLHPSPVITGEDFCEGGAANLSVTDVFDSYDWSNGDDTQAIAVTAADTYTVTVTNGNGCTETASYTVNALSNPDPTITGTLNFCEGMTTDLSTSQTYNDYNWSTNENSQGITVNQGGLYIVTVTDSNGCTADVGAWVSEKPLPSATLSTNSPICSGEDLVLTFDLTGTAPWSLNYFNGFSNVTVNIAASPYVATFSTSQDLIISMNSISDAFCDNTLFGNTEIYVSQPPTVSNINITCNDTNTEYTVTFDLSGGDFTNYVVGGDAGTLVGNTFTSDPITSGEDYSFSVDDSNQCGPILIEGTQDCSCGTFAGTMPSQAIQVCEDEIINVTNNGNENLDGDDLLNYILHTNTGTSIGTIFAQNDNGSFAFTDATPPLNYNTTYYVSAIAGNDDGSGVIDLSDDCLSVAVGTPISFLQNPTPTAEVGGSTCNTTWDLIAFPSLGVGNWSADPSAGVSFGNTNSSNTTVTITDAGDYTFFWTEDNNGCTASAEVMVTFIESIVVDAGTDDEICNDDYNLIATSEGLPGIWTSVPSAGVSYTNLDNPNTIATVTEPGVYTFTWTVENGECTVSDDVEITFYDGIGVTNRQHECIDNQFVVTFEIIGGDGNYSVDGSTDGLVGNVFTSQPIPSGEEYTFTITDSSPCFTFILIDDFFCNCTTDAGNLSSETIENCGFDVNVVVATSNTTLDDNDILVYVLHDGSDPLNILMSNSDGQFSFDETILSYGTTYYITALAGNDDDADGFPDSENDCYDTSNDMPVVFYGQPETSISADCGLTQSLTALLQTSTGISAWSGEGTWTFTTTGGGSVDFDDANNPTTNFNASEAGDYTFTWTGEGGCMDVVSTTLISPLDASWTAICADDLLTYTVTLTIEGGTTPYIVNNVPVVGTTYTETFNADADFSFDIEDNGVCESITIAGTWDCNCPSPNNPTPVAASVNYCSNEPIPTLEVSNNGVDSYIWYNDPSDAISIFEGSAFTPSTGGTATYWVQAVSPDGCLSGFVEVNLVENQTPPAPIVADATICFGNTLSNPITATTTNGSIQWSTDTGTSDTGNFDGSGLAIGEHIVTIFEESPEGCESASSSFLLTVEDCNCTPPQAPVAVSSQLFEICEDELIPTFEAMLTEGDFIQWFNVAVGGTAISQGLTFTPTVSGIYYAQAASNADECVSSRIAFELVINPNPPMPIVADATICFGVTLPNPITASTANGTLSWSTDTGTMGTGSFDGSGLAIGEHIVTIFEESLEGCESASASFALTIEDCSQVCPTVTSAPTASFEDCGAAERTLEITLNDPDNTLDRIEWRLNGGVVATDVTSLVVNRNPTGCAPTVLVYTVNVFCSLNPNTPILAGTFDLTFYPEANATITVLNGGCTVQAVPTCPNFSIVGEDTFTTDVDGDNSEVIFTVQNNDTTLGNNCSTTLSGNFNCVVTECPTIAGIGAGGSVCAGEDFNLSATVSDPNGKLNRVEWVDELGNILSSNLSFTDSKTFNGCDAQTFTYTFQIYCDDDLDVPSASNSVVWTVYPIPDNIVEVGDCSLEVLDVDCGGSLAISYSDDNGTTWQSLPNDNPIDGEMWLWRASVVDAPIGCNVSGEVTAVCICTPPQTPIAVSNQLLEICENEVIPTFEVMLADGDFVQWYDVAFDGMAIAQGFTFAPNEAGIYYAEVGNNGDDCVSERLAFELIVHPNPDNPIATGASYCEDEPIPNLTVQDNGTDMYFWYSDTTITSIAEGVSFTPSIGGTATYWVQGQSSNGCLSMLVAVDLTENALPPTPIVTDETICLGASLTTPITAMSANGILHWSTDTGASGIGNFNGIGLAIGVHVVDIFEESEAGCEGTVASFVLTVEDCNKICPTVTNAPTASFEDCGTAERTLEITLTDPDNTLDRIEWVLNGTVVATDITSLLVNETPTGCAPTVLVYTANIYCSLNPNTPVLAGTFDLTFYPEANATITVLNGGCTVQAVPTCPNFSIVGDDTVTTDVDGDMSEVLFVVQNNDTALGNNCSTTVSANFNCVITECPTIASINPGTSVCSGEDILLTATLNDPNGKLSLIEWVDNLGNVISNDLSFVHTEVVNGCTAQTFDYKLQIYCSDTPNTPTETNVVTWTVYPIPENIVAVGDCSLEVLDVDCGGSLAITYSGDNGTTWQSSPNDSPVDGETWLWRASVLGAPVGCEVSGEVTAVCDCTPPQIPIAVSSQLIEVCEGEIISAFEVMLVDGDFVQWYDVAIGGTAVGQGFTFMPVEAGTYYAEVGNDADDCVSERLVFELIVNPMDDASFSYTATEFCLGDISILSPDFVATAGGVFSADGGLVIDANTGAFDLSSVLQVGTFTITYTTTEPCSSSQSIEIEVSTNELVLDAGENIEICDGETISLNAVLQGAANLQWSADGLGNFSDPLSLISNFVNPDTGQFTLYITASNDCGADVQDSLLLTVLPSILLDIDGNTSIFEGESTVLEAIGDDNMDYIWSSTGDENSLSCLDCSNPTVSPSVTTTYFLNSNTVCANTASVTVRVEEVPSLDVVVESAFSPNGDGINDVFKPLADGQLETYQLFIFNRWGEKVFESEDITEGWNGTFKDELQPIGVYAYVIRYQFAGQNTKQQAGNVTIIR